MNLIKNQRPEFDKIYLHVKDPLELKYALLIKGREKVGTENLKNLKAFVDYSQTIDDVHKYLEDYNPTKKRRVLIVFDDVIVDMESNKKLCSKVIELFLRGRQLNISLLFISQSFFKVPKTIRLNATHYFIRKIPNKKEHQQIASNHSFDIDFKDFMKLYQEFPKKIIFILSERLSNNDKENRLRFRKN